jgi:UDP-glucose-4-epimerase GalE
MKVLVTGGGGFIGSHIVKQLIEAGHEPMVYDDFSTNKRSEELASVEVIEGDVRDSKKLLESLSGVDAVIHMAAFISVEESVKDPLKYMENNVLGAGSVLTAMRETGVKKIVFSSSATVYGEPKSLPITEDFPLSAANPYAASKVASEAICESFFQTDGFDVSILRYFNPYGPGEAHDPETHAIPNFIKAAMEKKPIPLYWKGEQVRDFIFVEDLAAAHISVLDLSDYKQGLNSASPKFNVFNVGTEKGVKIIDAVNVISDILGYSLEVEDKGDRKGDVMANYASSEKLKSATGWEAKVGLEEGLKKTVEWFKSRGS